MKNAELTKPTMQVFDTEKNDWVTITVEEHTTASYVHQQIYIGAIVSAMAIKKMFDGKLYIAMGCQNKEDYIDTMLPFGRTQTYKLVAIASKFQKVLPDANSKLLLSDNKSEVVHSGGQTDLELQNLGVNKLYELASLEDDELTQLLKKGKVKVGDGEITIDDVRDQSAKEFSKQIAELRKKYSSKISQLSEDNETLKEELIIKDKTNRKLQQRLLDAEELELKYGPGASLLEHKKANINKAREMFNDAIEYLVRSNVNVEDPQSVQKDLCDTIRKIDELHQRAESYFNEVIANVSL
jgi:hypothetical protein